MVETLSTRRAGVHLLSLLAFVVVLGAGYLVSRYVEGTIELPFTIVGSSAPESFRMKASDLFEILTWSIGLVVSGYCILATNVETWTRAGLMPARKQGILFCAFVVSAVLMAGGNVLHVFFNQFNGMAERLAHDTPSAWDLFVLVYFIDEHVSHAMIHTGILLVYGIAIAAEPVVDLPGEVTRSKARITMVAMLLGFATGALQMYAAIEGQSGLILLAGSWVTIITALAVHYKRGDKSLDTLRPFERPGLGFVFCFAMSATIVVLLWGLLFGAWPHYPFLKQPGEVF